MGNTTKEKIDERKIKILNTAFDIFVEKTIEAVSMGEIAEAAGVGRATLFRYYPSKLELVIASRSAAKNGRMFLTSWTGAGRFLPSGRFRRWTG